MRRKRFGICVATIVCSWVVISYFLFVYCPHCSKEDGVNQDIVNVNELEVQKLENKVEVLSREYVKLIENIKSNIKKKKASILLNKLKSLKKNPKFVIDKPKVNIDGILNEFGNINFVKNFELTTKVIANERDKVLENLHAFENSSIVETNMKHIAKKTLENGAPVIAVLVISCNRVTVRYCLDELIKWRPSKEQFPIIVSQDCSHQATTEVIRSYGDQVTLIQQPDQSEIPIPPKEKKFKGYFKIARHYEWALNQIFLNFNFDTAIIVEDDLTIAPDFYEYFLGTYWLLKRDPTLWCVSAWNDNGKSDLIDVSQPDLLYRTDFFPGLGWMLTSSIWAELSVKWPKSYWDDWIRKPEQRKDRACIRPELSRTKTFGKIGVSNGMFFEKHLKYIQLNTQYVSFTKLNLTYLLKDSYDVSFVNDVYGSPVLSYQELKNGPIVSTGSVRLPYFTKDQYKKTAKFIGLMDDFRSGVPRTAYRGVVTFYYKGRRVYLAPQKDWKAYDITWS